MPGPQGLLSSVFFFLFFFSFFGFWFLGFVSFGSSYPSFLPSSRSIRTSLQPPKETFAACACHCRFDGRFRLTLSCMLWVYQHDAERRERRYQEGKWGWGWDTVGCEAILLRCIQPGYATRGRRGGDRAVTTGKTQTATENGN